uniref:Uncharacterized protein n=1 Tax=Rhizophora mucronata TaxID=61149 RepID=A0A2P2M4N9_RHIMU
MWVMIPTADIKMGGRNKTNKSNEAIKFK